MISIDPQNITTVQMQGYLQSSVGPRPIALASTINNKGEHNVSPFSFFNVFSANPPILVFSPARRVRDATTKHTLNNVEAVKEVVINVVNYDMVTQTSLSSTEYPEGVDEFVKAGFTPIASDLVKPCRVKEAPVQFECKVNQIIALGDQGGAGNLIICEVIKMHVSEFILDASGAIDQHKIDLVSRMGGNWYSRANLGLFEIEKPLTTMGIGVDAIPDFIKESAMFSGNELGVLGNVESLPTKEEVAIFVKENFAIKAILSAENQEKVFWEAKNYLKNKDVTAAWKVLLAKMK